MWQDFSRFTGQVALDAYHLASHVAAIVVASPQCASPLLLPQPAALPAHACVIAAAGDLEDARLMTVSCILPELRERGDHEAALLHLARLAQQGLPQAGGLPNALPPSSPPPKGEKTACVSPGSHLLVLYLLGLGEGQRELLLRFAQWMLQREPEAVVELCSTLRADGSWPLPPEEVLPLLSENAPELTLRVLEGMLAAARLYVEEAGGGSNVQVRVQVVRVLVDAQIEMITRVEEQSASRQQRGEDRREDSTAVSPPEVLATEGASGDGPRLHEALLQILQAAMCSPRAFLPWYPTYPAAV